MRIVDAADLQTSLGTYLACAEAGESIVIRSHNIPVARLIPFIEDDDLPVPPKHALTAADFTEEQLDLAARGIMTLPKRRMDWEAFWQMSRPKVAGNALTQALLDEREEGR